MDTKINPVSDKKPEKKQTNIIYWKDKPLEQGVFFKESGGITANRYEDQDLVEIFKEHWLEMLQESKFIITYEITYRIVEQQKQVLIDNKTLFKGPLIAEAMVGSNRLPQLKPAIKKLLAVLEVTDNNYKRFE